MSDVNRVCLTGRLGRDPDVRSTASGSTVLGFSLAVSERRKNHQTGEWEDYTNWVNCTVFGNRAEPLSHILAKGMLVCVEGRLRWSQWERDGQKRSAIDVVVTELVIPSLPKAEDGGAEPQAQQGQTEYQGASHAPCAGRSDAYAAGAKVREKVGTMNFDGYTVPLYSEEDIPF